ncbi:MAG: haloacid dehalogenase-like hydrolase [Methyloceanibacter sp.]|uniref:HAD family hydrolase n=1 Tax=Methyloceanibacter sp. TaxID=1965321 RepID=UPI001DD9B736|nr:HAD family hydrolase [Methyloceanibacter sp.]MCB1442405.1 haloacid dehalogenase-like hydrolase [Methyloceanibacter sp.]
MITQVRLATFVALLALLVAPYAAYADQESDPLPSWNDGAVKTAILDYVLRVTTEDSPDFIAEADRIATFDNDGTLWVEKPVYTQFVFVMDRVKAVSNQHPEWKTKEPFKSVLDGNTEKLLTYGEKGAMALVTATHSGMTTVEFNEIVSNWLKTAKHPRFKRLYTDLTYKPMIELLHYLRAKGFKTFIVSGGGTAFMRAYTEQCYGIPPWQVVGSSGETEYRMWDSSPTLVKLPDLLFFDDGPGKAEGINHYIGRQPVFAFGNSIGDKEMLEWTANCKGLCFMGLVHHDDATREYAYGPNSDVGRFPVELMEHALANGWNVVSMKDDWNQVFSWSQSDAETSSTQPDAQ